MARVRTSAGQHPRPHAGTSRPRGGPRPGRHNIWGASVHAAYWRVHRPAPAPGRKARGHFRSGRLELVRPPAGRRVPGGSQWRRDLQLLGERMHRALREAVAGACRRAPGRGAAPRSAFDNQSLERRRGGARAVPRRPDPSCSSACAVADSRGGGAHLLHPRRRTLPWWPCSGAGPSRWAHVGRWDLSTGSCYEGGAWLGGRNFPRRCEICRPMVAGCAISPTSPERGARGGGGGGGWEHRRFLRGDLEAAVADGVARLSPLAAPGRAATTSRPTNGGAARQCQRARCGIRPSCHAAGVQFENGAPGWVGMESPDSPRRDPGDAWDQHRQRADGKSAGRAGGARLHVGRAGGHAGGEFAEQAIDGLRVSLLAGAAG